jgi:hypothetical protein
MHTRSRPRSTQALLLLARRHTALLSRFGAFLVSILDHLECFSDGQLRQVFEMFAALTTPAAGGAGASATCQGGRFEDELHITLTKALAHTRCARGTARSRCPHGRHPHCSQTPALESHYLCFKLRCTLPRSPCRRSPVYKRIGIVGGLAMLRREAAAYAAAAEGRGPGEPGMPRCRLQGGGWLPWGWGP